MVIKFPVERLFHVDGTPRGDWSLPLTRNQVPGEGIREFAPLTISTSRPRRASPRPRFPARRTIFDVLTPMEWTHRRMGPPRPHATGRSPSGAG